MRSDSEFSKLTPEQVESLEGWLFEENLSYKDALERAQKEFGVGGSLTGLRRFYRRLEKDRSRESLTDAIQMCVEAAASGNDDVLRAGLLTMANVRAVEFLMESPKDIKTFTTLLRALTSAQGQEMKRIRFEREEGWERRNRIEAEAKRIKAEEEKRSLEAEEQPLEEPRDAEEKAGRQKSGESVKAAEKAASEADARANATSPSGSRGTERERDLPAQPGSRSEAAVGGRALTAMSPGDSAKQAGEAAVIVPLKAA